MSQAIGASGTALHGGGAPKPTVFIQANDRQLLGAKIAAYSHKRNSRSPDSFDVRIINASQFPVLMQKGQSFLRAGAELPWNPDDLQSFTPLRFAPPGLMGFLGRALVTDPDCFAVADTAELLHRDLAGKAIWAVWQAWRKDEEPHWASSVMLLDCAKLRHWNFDRVVDGLFAHEFDYRPWNRLELEDQSTIGRLQPEWNSYDRLTGATKILHTTNRRTQPWKTGLTIEYTFYDRSLLGLLSRVRRPRYRRHPDGNQEAFVYSLLAEMIDRNLITRDEVLQEMAANHIRHDSLELVDRYRGWELFDRAA
jgi:hypothetical protein